MAETEQPFQFAIPFAKGFQEEESGLRFIEGIASTEDWDQQDEQMVLAGMDFAPLLRNGTINWNHSHAARDFVGLPVEACIKSHDGKPAFYVKAALLPQYESADYVWNLMRSLDLFNAHKVLPERSLGWSVEGGVLRKENGRILQTRIYHCAITQEPVNNKTWASVCKSFLAPEPAEPATLAKTATSGGDANPSLAGPADAGAALKMENLSDGGRRKGDDDDDAEDDPLTSVLANLAAFKRALDGGTLHSPHYDARAGRFAKGWDGMYDHLTKTAHRSHSDAATLIRWLRQQNA